MHFYTYVWLRKNLTPYYVGKGQGRRAFVKDKHRSNVPDEDWRILIFYHTSEEDAFEHEKFLICIFGRKDLGTGCLRNLTDGGEGVSGHNPWNKGMLMPEEFRLKLRGPRPAMSGPKSSEHRVKLASHLKHVWEVMKLKGRKPSGRPKGSRTSEQGLIGIRKARRDYWATRKKSPEERRADHARRERDRRARHKLVCLDHEYR